MKFLAPQAQRNILARFPCPNPKIHFYGNPVYLALSGKGQWQRIHSPDKFQFADYPRPTALLTRQRAVVLPKL